MSFRLVSAPVAVAALLLVTAMAQAQETHWTSRAADSELGFSAWYEGEELPGRFERFEARLQLDEASGEPRALTVEVEVGSADMNDREINEELGEPDWFDSAAFPRAVFSSSAIRRDGTDYLANGRLRLKGIDKALEIPLDKSRIFEIGGADQASYREIMFEYARQRGLKRWMRPAWRACSKSIRLGPRLRSSLSFR